MRRRPIGVALLFSLWLFWPASALAQEPYPGDDWCEAINSAAPGDEIFLSGDLSTTCAIHAAGTEDAPIVVRPSVMGIPSRFTYAGSSSNVIDFVGEAAWVELRGLHWTATNANIDAIKIKSGRHILIEDCYFEEIGGVSISANSTSTEGIVVRNNIFRDLKATGLYFGCHDGQSCQAKDLVIEGNWIINVDSSAVGYGMELKLNSWGLIRDNSVYNTKGPGIMVYGSDQGDPPSVLEGNLVMGSRTDGAIVVGGGPALVQNNVVGGGEAGGIVAQDYGGRGLQQGVVIVHNTVLESAGGGIRVQSWSEGAGNVLANNAIAADPALSPSEPAGEVVGNVACDWSCFVSMSSPYNLWPRPQGLLLDSAATPEASWMPVDDFMGYPRDEAPDVGAFESHEGNSNPIWSDGEVRPDRREWGEPVEDSGGSDMGNSDVEGSDLEGSDFGSSDFTLDITTENEGEPVPSSGESDGCGCRVRATEARGTGGRSLGLFVLFCALFFVRRSRE